MSAAAACSTALVPAGEAGVAVLLFVLLARSVLGVAQAALFPVASGVIETWFPMRAWGLAQGSIVTGLWVGAALTPLLIAWLMSHWGWREALIASSAPSLVLVLLWWGYACDRPDVHRSVRAEELAELRGNPRTAAPRVSLAQLRALVLDQRVVLLTLSYFLMNYVVLSCDLLVLSCIWCRSAISPCSRGLARQPAVPLCRDRSRRGGDCAMPCAPCATEYAGEYA